MGLRVGEAGRFHPLSPLNERIYLDYAATTPIAPEVREAMMPWLGERFGNPSSIHSEGREAQAALDEAREHVSKSLECEFAECVFTSGGTEAANLAIIGAALANRDESRYRVFVSSIEHHCVLNTRPLLERLGYEVVEIPVTSAATVDLDFLLEEVGDDVLLVSVMHANNEVGSIQPVGPIADWAKSNGALFHVDAVQSLGKLPCGFASLNADLVSVSAHKVYGPKGVGALAIRGGTKIQGVSAGGSQERELRAGTQNVAGIIGFGKAVDLFHKESLLTSETVRLRDSFMSTLIRDCGAEPTVREADEILGSHAHLRFPGLSNETLVIRLDRMGVSASAGAACSSGSIEASLVLLAMDYSELDAKEGMRFTFGKLTTEAETLEAAGRVTEAVESMRKR